MAQAGHDARRQLSDRRLRDRLRDDFDLTIMLSVGTVAILVVIGFSVFRFLTGNLPGAVVNGLIVLALGSMLVYVLRGGDTRRAGAVFVLVTSAACVASTQMFGQTGTYWTFMVLWLNFVLARRGLAVTASLLLVIAIAGQGSLFGTGTERAAYTVTALMVTAYAWFFSSRLALQRRQLEALAGQDPLTGAGNRRVMRQELDAAIGAGQEAGVPAVLAVLDLDHFKRINDVYGHEAGDRVLVRLAEIVRGRLRKTDAFFRFGGEEFVVLLPGTGLAEGRRLLEELHVLLGEGLGRPVEPAAVVTVSIGVAGLRPGEGWSGWLGRADAALYRAKEAGRNRVVVAEDPDQEGLDRRGAVPEA